MGLTSRAKMKQVSVDEVVWGRLTDAMRLEEGASLSRRRFVHPRIEPELAFLLKAPLTGEVTAAEAMEAVAAIAPAMEIIDSRYQNFKFALPDVIADNSSSSGFVVGDWSRPDQDFSNLGLVMEVDGRPVEIGSTAAILGDPIRSLVAAARLAGAALGRLEGRLDHPRRRGDGCASAEGRRARAASPCRTSDRSRSASRSKRECQSSRSP